MTWIFDFSRLIVFFYLNISITYHSCLVIHLVVRHIGSMVCCMMLKVVGGKGYHRHTFLLDQSNSSVKEKSRCHGNRKLYHFKRKWRARGLDEQAIQTLVDAKQHGSSTDRHHHQHNHTKKTSEKRKRDGLQHGSMASSIKSLSQLSISQPTPKKVKKTTDETISIDDHLQHFEQIEFNLHKFSKYLKMPRGLLLRSLRLQLNDPLKAQNEQDYILCRLRTLDEQFCLDRIRHLYQAYVDLGSHYQIWPVSQIALCCVLQISMLYVYVIQRILSSKQYQ